MALLRAWTVGSARIRHDIGNRASATVQLEFGGGRLHAEKLIELLVAHAQSPRCEISVWSHRSG